MIRQLSHMVIINEVKDQNRTNCNYTDWCKDQNWSYYKGYCQVICMLVLAVDWLSGGSQGAEYMLELYSSWTNKWAGRCVSLSRNIQLKAIFSAFSNQISFIS